MRPIPGAPCYYADEEGRIWSNKTGRFRIRANNKPRDGDGYITIALWIGRKRKTRYVHRLVCAAYHGKAAESMQASHIDNDPENNRPDNLVWETAGDNTRRKTEHGSHVGNAKLTAEDYEDIRVLLIAGFTQNEIATLFGVSQSTISNVKLGRTEARL